VSQILAGSGGNPLAPVRQSQPGRVCSADVSTNQAENYFSLLKRSIDCTHHHISVEYRTCLATWPNSTSVLGVQEDGRGSDGSPHGPGDRSAPDLQADQGSGLTDSSRCLRVQPQPRGVMSDLCVRLAFSKRSHTSREGCPQAESVDPISQSVAVLKTRRAHTRRQIREQEVGHTDRLS